MTARVAPYGSWPSPISAADVARNRLRLSFPTAQGDDVWWQETRPDEGGRTTVVLNGREILPSPWNARSRVHEYGGKSYLPTSRGLVFTNYADQRLYLLVPRDARPRPLTPEPAIPGGLRYADFVLSPDGSEVWCVCEGHVAAPAAEGEASGTPGVRRAIVGIPLDGRAANDPGAINELVTGNDFYASPTPSPSGGHLAWVQWNHPRMPWDGTELRVGVIQDGKVVSPRTVKGGMSESVLAPLWADDRSLYVASDWPGWWNIYQVGLYGESPQALYPAEEEFAGPLWQLGGMPYALMGDGRLVVMHGQGAQRLSLYDPDTLELEPLDLPYTDWQMCLSADGSTFVGIGSSPTLPASVVKVSQGRVAVLRRELERTPDEAYLPAPRVERFEGQFGRPVHAYVFEPANPAALGPQDELPPYVVFVHGGPTGRAMGTFSLERAYFTSRGIGVVEVDYGGSTGYGRAYRERLRRQWGVVDVEDATAVAAELVRTGRAHPDRLAVRGASAGGWTALAAVTSGDVFKAGTSYYGVSDAMMLLKETHDFESRYPFGLIGPVPGYERAYEERSPLHRADRTSCPVLLLQGLEDPVVPPAQSERFARALADNKVPHAYLTFQGESHGFRRAETVQACLEAELSFYGQTLGFSPQGVPALKLSEGEAPPAV
ncbi:S9 family peptidase [Actinocorallia populi]|uniref:S9 family peptidase n=1 Tax=Actinocorallia populi TaxID=2079200 RepID=UPI000D08E495|nr:prolyl oligopeptidase family serine peptidase [Actinocorallia populi]